MRTIQHLCAVGSVVVVLLAVASCTSAPGEAVGSSAAALSAEDAVRAACKGTYKNHGQCVSCVAHASSDGNLVSQFARGECHDACIRTSCAVEGRTCGPLADGCGGTLSCGPACAPEPIFLPAENHAAYQLRATCAVSQSNRVGTASSCCRTGTYATVTTCTTTLHEERDGAGNLTVRIDPVTGCSSTSTAGSCTRSGDLARCDAASLTCPPAVATVGSPSLLQGTYVRTVFRGGETPTDDYRGLCGSATEYSGSPLTCTPPQAAQAYAQMTTLTKTAPGTFSVRRAWGAGAPAMMCASPITIPPALATLPNTRFVEGPPPAGGTFAITGYDCSYELVLAP